MLQTHLNVWPPQTPPPPALNGSAIRRVIGESQHHPEDIRIPQPGQVRVQAKFTPPPAAWPTISASQSPLPLPEDLTPPRDDVSNRSQNNLSSLNSRFASTLSLRDGGASNDIDKAGISEDDDDAVRSTSTFNSPRNSPGISFSAADGPIWTSNGPVNSTGTALAFGNPFGMSSEVLSRVAPSQSNRTYATIPDPSASLSFGSLDGTITLQSVEQDPWNMPEAGKSSSYLSNPWST
ncbi:hypothetical protein M404DRAFT_34894 [Pisolithus tinctorius Marx 270]|uniref:Uncharacterized protein n=1 Tax=Pisolithus tinctorius Marx 270 TaxID=870435 RepID=A0A0C3NFK4_PISTI|nr:hypothetical protein M404DRAFT_34894 [Pisolithus tinctorius Marx 270]